MKGPYDDLYKTLVEYEMLAAEDRDYLYDLAVLSVNSDTNEERNQCYIDLMWELWQSDDEDLLPGHLRKQAD